MPYGGKPNFNDATPLSARAVNHLQLMLHDVYGRSIAPAVPAQVGSLLHYNDGDQATGYVIHKYIYPMQEVFYYDVSIGRLDTDNEFRLWYKATNRQTDTPLVRLLYKTNNDLEIWHKGVLAQTIVGDGTTRVRRALTLDDWPTAGTHPGDLECVKVTCYGHGPSTVINECCETRRPAGWLAMNDATALVDEERVDVANDLNIVALNADLLDRLMDIVVPGFKSSSFACPESNTPYGDVTRYFHSPKANSLYYRIGLHETMTLATIEVAGVDRVTVTSSQQFEIKEGLIDISGISRQVNQLVSVRVKGQSPVGDARGNITTYYLAEVEGTVAPAAGFVAQAEFVPFETYVPGNSSSPNLRVLYDNVAALADDAGNGYAEHRDVPNGYPEGYARAIYRSPVMWTRRNTFRTPGYHDWDVIELRRTRDILAYRTKGAKLVYTGDDGNEVSRGLEDYDDASYNHCRFMDLSSVEGLEYGRQYRVVADLGEQDYYQAIFAAEVL